MSAELEVDGWAGRRRPTSQPGGRAISSWQEVVVWLHRRQVVCTPTILSQCCWRSLSSCGQWRPHTSRCAATRATCCRPAVCHACLSFALPYVRCAHPTNERMMYRDACIGGIPHPKPNANGILRSTTLLSSGPANVCVNQKRMLDFP